MNSIGSKFRKWDLHVHTPSSFQNDYIFATRSEKEAYNGDIWEKFISELEKFKDIAVLGIVDYFVLDGYKKILEYKNAGRLSNFNLILPNIEFRLHLITSENRRLNLHVIFSDELDIDIIEDFINRIKLQISDPDTRLLQGIGCSRQSLIRIGKTYANNNELSDEKAWKIGCQQAFIDFNQLCDELEKSHGISGRYLIVGVEDSPGGLSELPYDQSGHLRTEIYRKCHMIESANENTRNLWLGKSESVNEKEIIARFGSFKPCIRGSDAHSFERLCKPDSGRFCWIKSDPTFIGLKQLLCEPEERVLIQTENPEPHKSIFTLKNYKIPSVSINEELQIEGRDFPLNPNLISVIGGKGNGKTAFLDLIANCFENRCRSGGKDKNSFVQRIEKSKPKLKIGLGFMNSEIFEKDLTDVKFFSQSRVTYLPQGKIEEYSSNRKKLHDKILSIVFKSRSIQETDYKEQFNQISREIKDFQKKIIGINTEILELSLDVNKERVNKLKKRKEEMEGGLRNKETELDFYFKSLDTNVTDKINTLRKSRSNLKSDLNGIKDIKTGLHNLKDKIESISLINEQIRKYNSILLHSYKLDPIPFIQTKEQLENLNRALANVHTHMENMEGELIGLGENIEENTKTERKISTLILEIESIRKELDYNKDNIRRVNEDKKKIIILTRKRKVEYIRYIKKFHAQKALYDKIIVNYSRGKDEILGNTDFKAVVLFDKNKFQSFDDIFDHRKVPPQEIPKLIEIIEAMMKTTNNIESTIERYFTLANKNKKYIKSTRSEREFFDWILGNYFYLSTEIYFDKKEMSRLSIGQRGTALLKIILTDGDHPLIIDQPEENLDNRFVYEVLVKAFRLAKKNRQIIIATHNANLVVNTDTEQIFVADFKNNIISYRWGSLENPEIRDDVTTLLEGGEEAFRKREKKYSIT